MGKIVKTVLKIAAVAAIAVFAPPVAAAIAGSVGVSGAIGTTLIAAGVGAGAGELAGVGWQAGLMAGGLSGANSSGLFGGGGAAGSTAGGTAGSTAPAAGGAAAAPPLLGPVPGGTTMAGAAAPTAAAAAAPTAAAAAPATLGGTLSNFASNPLQALGGGIKSMTTGLGKALGTVGIGGTTGGLNLGAVAPSLLAAGLVGNPGGAMAKAQQAELARAQQFNAAVAQQRLDRANQLYAEGEYSDPEFMGRQAAEAAMIKGGIQTAEQTRGLTGERLAAERRRMRLGTARTAGTAYQQGYRSGVGERLATRQAGISAMPTEYPVANPSYAMAADEYAQNARSAQARELSKLFGKALNMPTEDEQKPKGLTLKLV